MGKPGPGQGRKGRSANFGKGPLVRSLGEDLHLGSSPRKDHGGLLGKGTAHAGEESRVHFFKGVQLREVDGQPLAKVSKAMKALQEAWVTKPGAKAPGGESFQEYQDRTEEFLEVVSNVKRPKGRVNVAVVAHRNVLMMLAYCLNGGRLAGEEISMLDRIVQEPARLSVVKHTPSKGFQVLKMNVLEP